MIGIHCIYDIDNIPNEIVVNNDELVKLFDEICKKCELSILDKLIYKFEPHGFTGIYLLSESHLSFHTWPEYNKICLDIFSCNTKIPTEYIINKLKDNLKTNSINEKIFER